MMDHPNIARVFDGGTTPSGRPYFVMELVRGIPITDYCDAQKFTIRERLELFVLVCRAVQHAHQKGIIHRDLKPSNILITLHDGVPVPKVIDFGVAKATGQALTDKTVYTAFAQLIGTPLYMSPEQVELSGLDIDTRSDIYSLGVLLYELMTGTTPFDAETLRNAAFDEMRRIIREQEPQSPSVRLSSLGETLPTVSARRSVDARRLGPSLRGELDWVVMKSLEKDRRRRYETASDFAADVTRYLTDQPVTACPPSAGYRLRKFVRRNKGPVAAGLALAALLVLGTVGTSIGLIRALRAERRATMAAERAWSAEVLATDRLLEVTKEKERATAAETSAKQSEANAKEEAAIATAVKDFLQKDLLAQAEPGNNSRNRKVTVEEVLGRAAARIAGKFAQQPKIESEIRDTIGSAYRALGDYPAAQRQLERAWEIDRHALGEEHLNTLASMNNLASLYFDQGKFAQAEPLFVKVLEVARRVLGEEHPKTLTSISNLASLYQSQGKLAQAEPLFVKVLEVAPRALGEGHPDTLHPMNGLGLLYVEQGKLAQAEPLLLKALDISRRDLGEEHPLTLLAMNNLAGCYWAQGQYPKAELLFVKVLEVAPRALGEEHPDTLHPMNNLGSLYVEQGKLAQAEPLLLKALEVQHRVLGEEHPDMLRTSNNLKYVLALKLLKQQRYAEAEPLLRECLKFGEKLETNAWRTFYAKSLLGDSLLGQKKYAEAGPLLVAGYEGMKRREERIPLPIRKSRLIEAIERLVQLYEAWGKPEKAAEWRAKLPPVAAELPADVFARPEAARR
jgi:tetratricopeptide (TPR) repeat protein